MQTPSHPIVGARWTSCQKWPATWPCGIPGATWTLSRSVIFFYTIIRQSGNIFVWEGIFGNILSLFQWIKSLDCYQFSRWYPSFLDENTQIWMNNCTSTHMDEGGSCTVVKIASALILIIEKKIAGPDAMLHSRSVVSGRMPSWPCAPEIPISPVSVSPPESLAPSVSPAAVMRLRHGPWAIARTPPALAPSVPPPLASNLPPFRFDCAMW